MEYRSQKIAYWYFAAALPLFVTFTVAVSPFPRSRALSSRPEYRNVV